MYRGSASGNVFQPFEYGEMSPQGTVHVTSLTKHVGCHRRAVSLFTGTSSSSILGDLCTGPKRWAQCSGDQTSTFVWSRSAQWSGRDNGPRKWALKDACVETRICVRPYQQKAMWCV